MNRDDVIAAVDEIRDAAIKNLANPRNVEKGDEFGDLDYQRLRRRQELAEFDASIDVLTEQRIDLGVHDTPAHEGGDVLNYLASMLVKAREDASRARGRVRPREQQPTTGAMVSRGDVAPLG